jgi:hypothetical protein
MKKLVRTIGGIVVAASFASPALAVVPGRVLATAVVDGFTVNVLRFPTVARLNVPKSTTGTVTTGVNAQGTNPYGGTLLSGSPFLSINGGSATYTIKHPAAWIAFIWGTPDSYNTVSLYDKSGNLIGALNGGDIANAFGFTTGQYMQIISPRPVASVVAASSACCFEVGNQISKAAP